MVKAKPPSVKAKPPSVKAKPPSVKAKPPSVKKGVRGLTEASFRRRGLPTPAGYYIYLRRVVLRFLWTRRFVRRAPPLV